MNMDTLCIDDENIMKNVNLFLFCVNKYSCYISSSGGITVPNVIAINPTIRTIKRTIRIDSIQLQERPIHTSTLKSLSTHRSGRYPHSYTGCSTGCPTKHHN